MVISLSLSPSLSLHAAQDGLGSLDRVIGVHLTERVCDAGCVCVCVGGGYGAPRLEERHMCRTCVSVLCCAGPFEEASFLACATFCYLMDGCRGMFVVRVVRMVAGEAKQGARCVRGPRGERK